MNIRELKSELRKLNMTVTRVNGEYRVSYRHMAPSFTKRTAYYTHDANDALETARRMQTWLTTYSTQVHVE